MAFFERNNLLVLLLLLSFSSGIFAQENISDEKNNLRQLRKELLIKHNEVRDENGVDSLVLNEKLNAAAQRHAEDMCRHNYYSHRGKDDSYEADRVSEAGYKWKNGWINENIAKGQTTVKNVITSWVNSSAHFRYMIDKDSKEAGFGYCKGYWVAVFGPGEEVDERNVTKKMNK